MKERTILGIFAHPDDESMGPGGTLAKYAAEGHRVAFVTATAGGAGRLFDQRKPDDVHRLMDLRRRETRASAEILGIEFLGFLEWPDAHLDQMSVLEIEQAFAALIRREEPDVIITFHGSGISYHADHRVISLAVTGAFFGAGDVDWYVDEELAKLPPHRPSKLYHYTAPRERLRRIDWPRRLYTSPREEITTMIDTRSTQDLRWRAIEAHESQSGHRPPFRLMYDSGMFEEESFVRIFPSPRPGEETETDLLAGLRFERRGEARE
jgi:LmbE family N-acetylglucosaminyl deacetylase